jgi:hypothetical protein
VGVSEQYGIGMSLYFKFLKTMKNAFLISSLLACVPMYYNWKGSSASAHQKVNALHKRAHAHPQAHPQALLVTF